MDALKILNRLQARALERESRRAARRDFLRTAGGFGAGAAGAVVLTACGGGSNTSVAQTGGPSDEEILNFALNLEYLEAQFYSYAATGAGLPSSMLSGTGTQGTVTPGQKANLSSQLVINYVNEIVQDETNHVAFLRSALGSSAVAMPSIDVSASPTGAFSTAAQAAGLVPAGTAFNPYASDEAFLLGAYIFEDVGVTAYHGAASLISSKTYLDAAAGILAVEAYHAGLIRTALYAMGLATPAPSIDPFTATAAISAARAKLDGTNNDDRGIGTATAATIVDANSNSIAFDRTTAQVLNIVYLNASAVTMGGFFPAGVNGSINTSG
jgi:hypothetical protein